jgi:hypothetical protein
VLFFTRSWLYPRLFIGFLVLNVGIRFGDVMLVHGVTGLDSKDPHSSFVDLMRPVLYCVIWIPYFLKSVRVRNTFTQPWPVPAASS